MHTRTCCMLALSWLLLGGIAQAGGDDWLTDVEKAMKIAKEENKDILMDFTGSDWCHWCIKLDEEVFSQDEFASAKDKFVLVMLDFPNDDSHMEKSTIEQNKEWSDKLNIQGFPTIFLLDAEGRPYAQTGYRQGGAKPYVEHLMELIAKREARDEAMTKAESAEGIAKAKALHTALETMEGEFVLASYRPVVDQIIELDAENEAGLQEKYQTMLIEAEYRAKEEDLRRSFARAMRSGDYQAAIEMLDKELGAEDAPKSYVRKVKQYKAMALLEDERVEEAFDLVMPLAKEMQASGDVQEAAEMLLPIGGSLAQAEKYDEALKVFDMVLEMSAEDAPWRTYVNLQRGITQLEAGDLDAGCKSIDALIESLDDINQKTAVRVQQLQALPEKATEHVEATKKALQGLLESEAAKSIDDDLRDYAERMLAEDDKEDEKDSDDAEEEDDAEEDDEE